MNDNRRLHLTEVLEQLEAILSGFFAGGEEEFVPGKTKIRLALPSYDQKEVLQVLESLLSKNLTLNQKISGKVMNFENLWAQFINVQQAVMVNSGSSANLLALNVLSNPLLAKRLKPSDEIITPALTWSTTVSPIFNIQAVPVWVDIAGPDYLAMDAARIEEAITEKTRAIMPVHLLGYPCDMKAIMDIARRHDLYVIEDACEAHGAEIDGGKAGSFGDISTFSFFFSHHLSTIEGGMLLTNNNEFAEIARTMRSEGIMRNAKEASWIRKYAEEYGDLDPNYLFANIGFNFRPTELQGGFGLEQFKKFPSFLRQRTENCEFFLKTFEAHLDYLIPPRLPPRIKHAWFAYPVILRPNTPFTARDFRAFLEQKGIETRSIMSGDFRRQPLYKLFKSREQGSLKHAEFVHDHGFFFGNHAGIGKAQREYIAECFSRFFGKSS